MGLTMDVLAEAQVLSKASAENKSENDIFWVICTGNGFVSLCSNVAAEWGIIPGVTPVSSLICKQDIPILEDVLRKGCGGGDVSVTVTAAPETGFEIVRVKSVRLFSSIGAELRFYKNREEYLAVSAVFGERLGKVFDYISTFAAEISSAVAELAEDDGASPLIGDRILRLSELNDRLINDSRFISSGLAENEFAEDKICDITKVFDAVGSLIEAGDGLPFTAAFENLSAGNQIICATEPKRFAEIILMLTTVAARLSENRQCMVTLSGDGYTAVVEAECRLRKEYDLYGRSEDFENVYRCIPANPIELMMLERLTFVPEWKAEYSADGNRGFILRARIVAEPNPDGLKYRDVTATVPDVFRKYSDYVKGSFLPDPKK